MNHHAPASITVDPDSPAGPHLPDRPLALSRSQGGVSVTTLTPWNVTFGELCSELSQVPEFGTKDGAYFVRGGVDQTGQRSDQHLPRGDLIVLDGDKTIDPDTGERHPGAPDPHAVQRVLNAHNLRHCIYTSHSHGRPGKGPRYRVLLPCALAGQEDLCAGVDWLLNLLHEAGIMLAPVSENYRWSQPWYFPRRATDGAPYVFLDGSQGAELRLPEARQWYRQRRAVVVPASVLHAPAVATSSDPRSPMGQYRTACGSPEALSDLLMAAGYHLHSSAMINGQASWRFLAPESTSGQAGTILFCDRNGIWRVYAHGDSDPLGHEISRKDGKRAALDAFDVYRLLQHQGQESAALAAWAKHPRFDPALAAEWRRAQAEVPPDYNRWRDRYVFVKQQNAFLDTHTQQLLKGAALNIAHGDLELRGRFTSVFERDPAAVKVDTQVFLPGTAARLVPFHGGIAYNIWSPPDWSRLPAAVTDDEVAPYLEHASYLLANPAERHHVLDWCAWVLQRPGQKINHALLIAGPPRTGKDTLIQPLLAGVGRNYCADVGPTELEERFTNYLENTKLVVFQEVMNTDRNLKENQLKPLLAAPPELLRIRLFGLGYYTTPNLVQAIFFSNHKNALKASTGDGRYYAVWCEVERRADAYYTELWRWLTSGGQERVIRWLLQRDLAHFQPTAPARDTAYKRQLVAMGKSDLEQKLTHLFAGWPPEHTLFQFSQVRDYVHGYAPVGTGYTDKAISNTLQELGCVSRSFDTYHAQQRDRITIWSIRPDRRQNKEWYRDFLQQRERFSSDFRRESATWIPDPEAVVVDEATAT